MDERETLGLGLDTPAQPSREAEAYRVLARKYRPQDFTGLIGQDALVRTLSNAFACGRIAHAFMLTGVRGVGKTTTARIIARALNCIGPDGKRKEPTIHPCGICEPCAAIAESRHMDVQEMDGASNNGVEEVRQIIDSVRYAPASARYKVYIIDEVHMLSKAAFNALLKTLEEPPPHVKFVFATTEIRKVPVTILSRCQKFDLRRIETPVLIAHLRSIAQKENIQIEEAALALVARAAEGSVRDSLSLLDQAIAHEEGHAITGESVRGMLGLADRGRVLDLFERLMGGDISAALADLSQLYDCGADPLAVMQDLLEITHFLTRLKVAPNAEGFFDGGSAEAKRAAEMAGKLPMPALTRAWQLLLKGLLEVRDATRPIQAAEMALVRLAYAADLPPTDKLVRDLLDGTSEPRSQKPEIRSTEPPRTPPSSGFRSQAFDAPTVPNPSARTGEREQAAAAMAPQLQTETAPHFRSLEELAAFAAQKGAPVLKVHIENDMHLIRLEPGRIEFRPSAKAPHTLAADLAQKLKDWTSVRWVVSVAREGGAPTIAEARRAAAQAKLDSVAQEPLVRAVLDRFPGAEIVGVHDRPTDAGIAPEIVESSE
ncbi:MAG: DNA polymerase III subunit gamma/tau [Alphaproteobacteria bacterium]|nr:DNA polymerase III subunit gamma/tau [Alphaproteobacteria bacterium]